MNKIKVPHFINFYIKSILNAGGGFGVLNSLSQI